MTIGISTKTVGITGLCLSGTLLTLGIWRIGYHFSGNCKLTTRKVFHLLFCLAMLAECLSYADLCRLLPINSDRNVADRWGFVFLETIGRSLLEVLAYSIITAMWFQTARPRFSQEVSCALKTTILIVLSLLAVILTILSIAQAIDILLQHQTKFSSKLIYQSHNFVEGACWIVHSTLALISGFLTTQKILHLPTFPSSDQKFLILSKALVPMVICALCYACRSLWLFSELFHLHQTESTPHMERSQLSFWVGFVWIPTLIPGMCLLYSARKRDVPNEAAAAPLLISTPPRPPAEAFVSFQNFENSILTPLNHSTSNLPSDTDE